MRHSIVAETVSLQARARTPHADIDPWRARGARNVRFRDRLMLVVMSAVGFAAIGLLAEWWFRGEHVASLPLFVLLSLAFWYSTTRVAVGWIACMGVRRPAHRPAPTAVRVAIFTTSSPGEPLDMFEVTLAACARIRYSHTTYLLDDTRDPRYRAVAERHGAVWLELVGLAGAKAGKINRALELTQEEFILVLDPDHIPFPEFLDRVLGHFDDARVGFVQVSQAYYNASRSFVARGAAEQTYAFYGPLMMGMFGHGCSVAIGANCTFRRSALASIGGHGVGLAEDLVTAIRLHAAGWGSVYVPEVVSRGLVPEDLGSFYKQQLKWTRGVFEVLFAEVPRHFRRLSWMQRFSYMAIGTYYFFGVTWPVFLLFPYLYLWAGLQPAAMRFEGFLTAAAPVGLMGLLIYFFSQRWLCHRSAERGLHWRGFVLKVACWPVYLAGTGLAVARANVPYIPTSKQAVRGRFLRLAWPHLFVVCAFVATLAHTAYVRVLRVSEGALALTSEAVWGMTTFAGIAAAASAGALYAAWETTRPHSGASWQHVQIETIGEAGEWNG
jgi:cellulose synthase (UDP-forming)